MKDRIEQLERIIPKVKANKKILPKAIECMEWELRALKAEQQVKNCSIPDVRGSFTANDIEEVYKLGREHEKNNSNVTAKQIRLAWVNADKWYKEINRK